MLTASAEPMRFRSRRRVLIVIAAAVVASALAAPGAAAGAAWRPHVQAARAYAAHRHGSVAFAVRTESAAFGWHERRTFPSASVLKAMLLVAYLNEHSVRNRPLHARERALLAPMIRRSDNTAASSIFVQVGTARLRALARRAGMRRFAPAAPIWGNSRIDAADQSRFFLHIDHLVPKRHRRYAMYLLAHVVPSQRWGIGRVVPRGWRIYFKGGWGSGTGRVDHQVALLTRGSERLSVAILTYADGSHAYGKETLRGVAKRLLRGLAEPQAASASR